jgi:hypothetical protein
LLYLYLYLIRAVAQKFKELPTALKTFMTFLIPVILCM